MQCTIHEVTVAYQIQIKISMSFQLESSHVQMSDEGVQSILY